MLNSILTQLRLTWRLLRDPRVPLLVKLVPFLGVAYIILPLDFLPDFIPVIGQLDDLTIIVTGLKFFERLVPQDLVREHRHALEHEGQPVDVVEGRGRRVDKP